MNLRCMCTKYIFLLCQHRCNTLTKVLFVVLTQIPACSECTCIKRKLKKRQGEARGLTSLNDELLHVYMAIHVCELIMLLYKLLSGMQ